MIDGASHSSPGTVPADSNLESWVAKAAANEVHYPALWRAIKGAELHVIVPCDPTEAGEFEIAEGEALTLVTLEDPAEGPYAPIFTTVEEADAAAASLGTGYGVASLEGETLFEMLANAGHRAVINPFGSPRLKITPQTVQDLATGQFIRHRHAYATDHHNLVPVAARDMPHDFLVALRGICAKRRALSGLYLFNPVDPDSLIVTTTDLRFLLRMAHRDDTFCRDFKDLATRSMPRGSSLQIVPVTEIHTETLAFLDTIRPIWPV